MAKENSKELKPSEMSVEDIPDVRALQDEFTRGFIQSAEEVEVGYYPFLSGTKKYKMLFPTEGLIHQQGYAIEGDYFEGFLMSVVNENGTDSQIKVNYYSSKTNEFTDRNKQSLEGRVDQKLSFEEIITESSEIYYAPIDFGSDVFGIAAFIQNVESDGAVEIVYDTQCPEDQTECEAIKEDEIHKMIDWIQTIEFINK